MILPDRSPHRPPLYCQVRCSNRILRDWVAASLLILCSSVPGAAQCQIKVPQDVRVTTQHNDNDRTGANLKEVTLSPGCVRSSAFGKVFDFAVDGDIYAQPLYVPAPVVTGLNFNVVYVATMHNTVYAFDADGKTEEPLWRQHLEDSVLLTGNEKDFNGATRQVIQREIGIVSTPVISVVDQAIYVVTFTKDGSGYHHFIHELSLNTGNPLRKRVIIDHSKEFSSRLQIQRSGLLLSKGTVYVAFASYGDQQPFHGWIFGFNAKTLEPLPTEFNTTPNGQDGGGIWQAGQGPAADLDGYIYVMSGNGSSSKDPGPPARQTALGDSFIKLGPNLSVDDRFTPWNADDLDEHDLDLGSGGPLLFASSSKSLIVGGGKEGVLYLLDRGELGGLRKHCVPDRSQTNCGQIVQWFQATTPQCRQFNSKVWPKDPCFDPAPGVNSQGGYYHLHGSPVFWKSVGGATYIYVWGEADRLRRFKFDNATGKFDTKNVAKSPADVITPTRSMPGAMLSLSANGSGSGIVWATHPGKCKLKPNCNESEALSNPACWCDANIGVVPGMLRAIDASSTDGKELKQLWNSEQVTNDHLGYLAKFTAPTIANGRVYVATFAEPPPGKGPAKLVVYGLKPQNAAPGKLR